MARSFVRLMAGVALVAVPMVSVQAQTCTVPTIGGTCDVAFNATLTVPVLASLDVAAAGTLPLTTPDFATFFTTPTAQRTVSQTAFTVRSNSPHAVAISATAWTQPSGAGRAVGDLSWAVATTTCPGEADITASVASGSLVTGGAPTGGTTRLLCLALDFPGDLTSTRLLPGAYTLPLTLTITAP
jgi:hypothetical protein